MIRLSTEMTTLISEVFFDLSQKETFHMQIYTSTIVKQYVVTIHQ